MLAPARHSMLMRAQRSRAAYLHETLSALCLPCCRAQPNETFRGPFEKDSSWPPATHTRLNPVHCADINLLELGNGTAWTDASRAAASAPTLQRSILDMSCHAAVDRSVSGYLLTSGMQLSHFLVVVDACSLLREIGGKSTPVADTRSSSKSAGHSPRQAQSGTMAGWDALYNVRRLWASACMLLLLSPRSEPHARPRCAGFLEANDHLRANAAGWRLLL